jgi:hypothetical protein
MCTLAERKQTFYGSFSTHRMHIVTSIDSVYNQNFSISLLGQSAEFLLMNKWKCTLNFIIKAGPAH